MRLDAGLNPARRRPGFSVTFSGPVTIVNKLCTFGGAAIGSYLGWILGARLGWGTAFALSGLAALAGVYAGWRLARRLR